MTEVYSFRRLKRVRLLLMHLARRPIAGTVVLLVLCATGMAATSFVVGTPVPHVYDEFAYLLSADTFAEGRLTNPTHPHWRHFETFEVIHQPTYQAKYPPAQGLFLAVGILLGHSVVGVWLGVLLMVAATAWALRSLLRPEWAFAGTLLLVLQLGIASYWAQSYWGGAVAAAGGALAFGGATRLIGRNPAWWHGALGGTGLALLANSRPLEGLILAVALLSWVSILTVGRGGGLRFPIQPAVAGLFVTLAGLAFTGIYNHAVTGDPLTLPYTVHESTYAKAPFLLFAPVTSPEQVTIHDEIERQHRTRGLERHERLQREGLAMVVLRRGPSLLWSIGGPALLLLLALPLAWHTPGVKTAAVILSLLAVAVLLTPAAHPHYLAPAIAPLYLLFGAAARGVATRFARRPLALLGIGGVILVLMVLRVDRQVEELADSRHSWSGQREQLASELQLEPGRDLVFVHYPENYGQRIEWVYNRADIDEADVVWARPINPDADLGLIEYFAGHRVWDLIVGREGESRVLRQRLDATHPAKADR